MNITTEKSIAKPERLFAPPREVRVGSFRFTEYVVLMDDGQKVEMPQKDLAALLNCEPSTIYTRILRLGWGHPDVLRPGKGQRPGTVEKRRQRQTARERGAKAPGVTAWRDTQLLLQYCPVTCNQPTRTTLRGFLLSCKTRQMEKNNVSGRPKYPHCQVCKGKVLPKGLVFITA